jgi:hypothetical protein
MPSIFALGDGDGVIIIYFVCIKLLALWHSYKHIHDTNIIALA